MINKLGCVCGWGGGGGGGGTRTDSLNSLAEALILLK